MCIRDRLCVGGGGARDHGGRGGRRRHLARHALLLLVGEKHLQRLRRGWQIARLDASRARRAKFLKKKTARIVGRKSKVAGPGAKAKAVERRYGGEWVGSDSHHMPLVAIN